MLNNREALLRYIVAIHFLYTSLALLTEWLPPTYSLNQMAILVLGLWAIARHESAIQVELLMVIKCGSIFLDAICIGLYFDLGLRTYRLLDHSFYFTISAFFAISLLIIKPVMLILLNKVRQDRLGDSSSSPIFTSHRAGYTQVEGQQTV
ncbi:unnamed protein product [Rotaria socialis]|uniref:Uncharacterized protein n=1 Tax=Rotaria socialis TaxID=392032 RepID=A0A820CWP9_9BILA|nr:unnamed protein product [Rotaria socialis]CAF3401304.1 unnamed protein product [Rotaria socialis]CAF3736813.1 unnamed protein product [Rotaria socialis]CAF4227891.1 unnamed protein product [Rotaria socialis]CAF4571111.1 unnamed protein product [Rotaria socialis]